MDSLAAEIRKIPPVTRFLCASSLGVTIPVLMNMVSAYKVLYARELVFKKFELWRLFTSFFLGSGGINYIFELAMLYRTTEQLESGPYSRRSADLAYQLMWAAASIIFVSTPLKAFIFNRPLLVCMVYLSSALAPLGSQTSLMGLVTFPVAYLPYVMIGLDFLMGGPSAAVQAIAGAVVGHFWWWGVWGGAIGARGGVLEQWLRAPQWVRNLVGEGHMPRPPPPPAGAGVGMGGGVEVIPPRQTRARTSGHNWGPGRALGSS